MLSLDADEWKTFIGGYRSAYDASVALKILENQNQPSEAVWNELWENLYHQGDVGIASYAAVPQIFRIYREKKWLDYHLPNFAAAVEEARTEERNPVVPDWLAQDYFGALRETAQYCLANSENVSDKNFSRAVLMLTAILLKEKGIFDLLDFVSIGEEERVLEVYNEFG